MIVLVYDITSRVSFDRLVHQHVPIVVDHPDSKDALKILVGNKIDLEKKRAVAKKDGQRLAASIGALFYEVSARSQCSELIDVMVEKCIPVLTKRNLFSII